MKPHPAHRRYLITLTISAILLLLAAAAINLRVDPYDIFGSARSPGLNAAKPALHERVRIAKPYQAERIKATTVIGGNSRLELGLNPDSSCWNSSDQPVYNAAIPGASFRLQTLFARHALMQKPGSKLFMAIDFADFLIQPRPTLTQPSNPPSLSPDALRLHPQLTGASQFAHQKQRLADRLSTLFSLTTLTDAFHTIAAQRNPYAPTRLENGFNPANDFIPAMRAEGQRIFFDQKNKELADLFGRPNLSLRQIDGTPSDAFATLEELLTWSKQHEVQLTLFINPYHIDYLMHIHAAGLWPLFETWKTDIVSLLGSSGVPLIDFNSVDATSTEAAPARGDTSTMLQWYLEPAHYTSKLGERMLSGLNDSNCTDAQVIDGFGTALEADSMAATLEDLRSQVLKRVTGYED